MSLIIDAYNLLHASGILGKGVGPGGLERSRNALLNFLANSLNDEEIRRTTVVFDAANAPPGLPRTTTHEGMTVRYASEYEDADSLIEELILQDSAPKSLTVVSSDHRIQRAASRRKAKAVDSDRWYAEMLLRRQQQPATETKDVKPMSSTPGEVAFWVEEFAEEPKEPGDTPPPTKKPEVDNPFPPGYFDDLEEEL
jgi:predicted RNA-binding protein with PIN domain